MVIGYGLLVMGSCVPSCVPLVASVTRRDAERGSKRPLAERWVIDPSPFTI